MKRRLNLIQPISFEKSFLKIIYLIFSSNIQIYRRRKIKILLYFKFDHSTIGFIFAWSQTTKDLLLIQSYSNLQILISNKIYEPTFRMG